MTFAGYSAETRGCGAYDPVNKTVRTATDAVFNDNEIGREIFELDFVIEKKTRRKSTRRNSAR